MHADQHKITPPWRTGRASDGGTTSLAGLGVKNRDGSVVKSVLRKATLMSAYCATAEESSPPLCLLVPLGFRGFETPSVRWSGAAQGAR